MESDLINIKLIKVKRDPKEKRKYLYPSYKLNIINLDNFLTEKIISKKISLKNLYYKTIIYDFGDLQKIIRANFIPKYFLSENFLEEKYIPGKIELITEFTDNEKKLNLNPLNLYKIKTYLISKIPNLNYDEEINTSNEILYNLKLGVITLKDIEKQNEKIFSKKKIFSKSEKDNIKYVEANTKLNELNDILDTDDIKKFTHENRTYENIEQFINSKNKASKLLTEQRKKKIVFSTQSRMHFEDKIEYENEQENPFMKNEWFMGPIYSYDYNYEKYI
jgi:hypothetical protein